MVYPEQVAKVKSGYESWNEWRQANPDIRPDLRGSDLRGANLSRMNLSNNCFDDSLCILGLAVSFAAENPNTGTWKLDEASQCFLPGHLLSIA